MLYLVIIVTDTQGKHAPAAGAAPGTIRPIPEMISMKSELTYKLEYVVDEVTGERTTVIVIMTGTREKLYDELKRYWL